MSTSDPSPFALADASMAAAPKPTAKTLRQRNSIPLQLIRFVALNLKIVRMVLKGHSG
jgi:hypothetical protein